MERLSLFTSVFFHRDEQEVSLDLSSFQRYFQSQGLSFFSDGADRFRSDQLSVVLGGRVEITEATAGRLSYAFTHAAGRFPQLSQLSADRIDADDLVDSDIHTLDLFLEHRVRPGLRVSAGYRFRHFDDDAPSVESDDDVFAPFDPSTHQHTLRIGVTLTSEILPR